MTIIHRTSLLRFCLGLLLASLAATGFAAKKPAPTKSKAATAKVVKKSVAKPVVEDHGPGAIQGKFVKRANLKQEAASQDTRQLADWVVDSGDNKNMPFVIIDKKEAKVFVFHAHGGLRGAAPILLGIAIGDETYPGLGNKPLSEMKPEEKTCTIQQSPWPRWRPWARISCRCGSRGCGSPRSLFRRRRRPSPISRRPRMHSSVPGTR